MKSILLLEDNFLNRRQIKTVLAREGYDVKDEGSVEKAFLVLEHESIDLAILDIHLGISSNDGIAFAQEMDKKYKIPYLYLTAYETKDIIGAALATTPSSYLTKPFKDIDLLTAVALAIKQNDQKEETASLIIKEDGYQKSVPASDIFYIEAEGNYVHIVTEAATFRHRITIKNILEILPIQFIQTHRAFVINKDKIEKHNSRSVIIKKREIPTSSKYTKK